MNKHGSGPDNRPPIAARQVHLKMRSAASAAATFSAKCTGNVPASKLARHGLAREMCWMHRNRECQNMPHAGHVGLATTRRASVRQP